jgi:hypothetical protein
MRGEPCLIGMEACVGAHHLSRKLQAIARRKMKTKAFARSRDERKRVEMRFAHLKTHHRFERMRLRGLSGARDEFHLAAIVQNLKTLALRTLATKETAPIVRLKHLVIGSTPTVHLS